MPYIYTVLGTVTPNRRPVQTHKLSQFDRDSSKRRIAPPPSTAAEPYLDDVIATSQVSWGARSPAAACPHISRPRPLAHCEHFSGVETLDTCSSVKSSSAANPLKSLNFSDWHVECFSLVKEQRLQGLSQQTGWPISRRFSGHFKTFARQWRRSRRASAPRCIGGGR